MLPDFAASPGATAADASVATRLTGDGPAAGTTAGWAARARTRVALEATAHAHTIPPAQP
jgi:hypothetical protein